MNPLAKYHNLIRHFRGPFGAVYSCNLCAFHQSYGKSAGGGEAQKARGRVIAHLKSEHRKYLDARTCVQKNSGRT